MTLLAVISLVRLRFFRGRLITNVKAEPKIMGWIQPCTEGA